MAHPPTRVAVRTHKTHMLPTAQSPTLSSVLDQLTAALLSAGVDGPGIDEALHQFAGVPYQTVNKTGFNVLALHVNSARGMVLSHPEMALRPCYGHWVARRREAGQNLVRSLRDL